MYLLVLGYYIVVEWGCRENRWLNYCFEGLKKKKKKENDSEKEYSPMTEFFVHKTKTICIIPIFINPKFDTVRAKTTQDISITRHQFRSHGEISLLSRASHCDSIRSASDQSLLTINGPFKINREIKRSSWSRRLINRTGETIFRIFERALLASRSNRLIRDTHAFFPPETGRGCGVTYVWGVAHGFINGKVAFRGLSAYSSSRNVPCFFSPGLKTDRCHCTDRNCAIFRNLSSICGAGNFFFFFLETNLLAVQQLQQAFGY